MIACKLSDLQEFLFSPQVMMMDRLLIKTICPQQPLPFLRGKDFTAASN